ncbi:hypothetical protein AVEN_177657-1 [Araneus ventricosus]|uniref:Uncharacterized protein n=1 Tax=Araneus ventricosus TaxID=182803 RepID=A0A4Y2FWG8_ARAVE|nr:hypothetical protein AVEN_177657-1 [Araneus ventricosus]
MKGGGKATLDDISRRHKLSYEIKIEWEHSRSRRSIPFGAHHSKALRQCKNPMRIGVVQRKVWKSNIVRFPFGLLAVKVKYDPTVCQSFMTAPLQVNAVPFFSPSIKAGHSRPLHTMQIYPLWITPIPYCTYFSLAFKTRNPRLLRFPLKRESLILSLSPHIHTGRISECMARRSPNGAVGYPNFRAHRSNSHRFSALTSGFGVSRARPALKFED